MEIDGFFKHFDENQIIYTENDKEELLKKFAGYIDYHVKKQIPPKNSFVRVILREMYNFREKIGWNLFREAV